MIGKVVRGQKAAGLLHYLFGPGRSNEHTDPHLVAAWDPVGPLQPSLRLDGKHELRPLALLLDQPLHAAPKVPDRPVWLCAVRAAPQDRTLDDAEWQRIARDVVDRTGIAPAGDPHACRWVAVRHADDHIHIVATLARQDGRRVALSHDYYRVGEACRTAEERLGLRLTGPRDRTAARRPTRAELEKAGRSGAGEPPRTRLRRSVQHAAARTSDPAAFLEALHAEGVLVRERRSDRDPTQVTGYAVALRGDHNADGAPVWFSGSKLAPDLTWNRLQQRWDGQPTPPAAKQPSGPPDRQPSAPPWRDAQAAVTAAEAFLRSASPATDRPAGDRSTPRPSQPQDVDAVIAATGDLTVVLARVTHPRRDPRAAALIDDGSRATRLPYARGALHTPLSAALRFAARDLSHLRRYTRAERQLIELLRATAGLVDAVIELQRIRDLREQGRAGLRVARQLRTTATALEAPSASAPRAALAMSDLHPVHQTQHPHPGRHR